MCESVALNLYLYCLVYTIRLRAVVLYQKVLVGVRLKVYIEGLLEEEGDSSSCMTAFN